MIFIANGDKLTGFHIVFLPFSCTISISPSNETVLLVFNVRLLYPAAASAAVAAHDNSTSSRGCSMAGEFHAAGSSWHPYLPPHGFDTCAVCMCDAGTLRVSWTRVRCPMLACDEHLAFRPEKKACCKQCPEPPPPVINTQTLT